MVPRKLLRWIVALILSAFLIVLMFVGSVEIKSKTIVGRETEAEWTTVSKAQAENRKSVNA